MGRKKNLAEAPQVQKNKKLADVIPLHKDGVGRRPAADEAVLWARLDLGETEFCVLSGADGRYRLGLANGQEIVEIPTPGIEMFTEKVPPTFFLSSCMSLITRIWLSEEGGT